MATLNAADEARLRATLGAIGEPRAERWTALDQLCYFCDGANTPLLEAIGSRQFSTLQVLLQLLEDAEALGGPVAVRAAPALQQVPVSLVLQLLESLLCNATNNLKPFLKTPNGVRLLLATLDHQEDLVKDVDEAGIVVLDRACNILCDCAFHHPELAASQLLAANGVAIVSRLLRCAADHYNLSLPHADAPAHAHLSAQTGLAKWDELTGDVCELIANAASSDERVQRLFVQNGALRSLIDLVPLLTAPCLLSVASSQPSLSFVTEQVLLAASTLVWCSPSSQRMLCDSGTIEQLLSAMLNAYARLSSPSGGESSSTQHDTIVYQSSLLLVLNAQLENKQMQETVDSLCQSVAKQLCHQEQPILPDLYKLYQNLFDAFEHIQLNHHHSDEVVKALRLVGHSLDSCDEAPYLLVNMHGTRTLDILLRCLSNIDEEVLLAGCCSLYALIQRSPPARLLFLRKNGVAELSECLRDYNTSIKSAALQIMCALAAENAAARDQMREEDLLMCVLRTIQSYPAEDVTLGVLDAALEAVAHMVTSCPTNQEYIRNQGGLEPLVDNLSYIVDHIPGTGKSAAVASKAHEGDGRSVAPSTAGAYRLGVDELKVVETACHALSSVIYHCMENQAAALQLGAVPICMQLLERDVGAGTSRAIQVSALNLLINLSDSNPEVQDALGTQQAATCIDSLLSAKDSVRVICATCLLLSHVSWNHERNQLLFSTERTIRRLLSFLTQTGRAEVGGSRRSGHQEDGLSDVPEDNAFDECYAAIARWCKELHEQQVQDMVRVCGGVPLLHLQLSSPHFQLRRTAAFCLGNLVRDNAENAQQVVAHGGVELLLRCLSDVDDDELSKTAYSTITHLGPAGLTKLLSQAQQAVSTLEAIGAGRNPRVARLVDGSGRRSAEGLGSTRSLREALNELREQEVDDFDEEEREMAAASIPSHPCSLASDANHASPRNSSHHSPEGQVEAALGDLGLLVPVLNGLVYSHDLHRAACLASGLPLLLSLLVDALPKQMLLQVLHLFHNAFFGAPLESQLRIAASGGMEIVLRQAERAHAANDVDEVTLAMTVLCSVIRDCSENCVRFARSADAMTLTNELCRATMSEPWVAACELLVSLFECGESRTILIRTDATSSLQAISSSTQLGEALATRAKVILRDFQARR